MLNRLERILRRQFITSDDIRNAVEHGDQSLAIPENSTVTDEARELALKLSLRLDEPGREKPATVTRPSAAAAVAPETAPAMARSAVDGKSQPTLPDDIGRRVTDAIAAVLKELDLGDRAESLLPIITRRVFAGLTAGRR